MTPPTVSRLVVLSVVGALVLAACGPATESPSPSATPAPTPSAVPASPASPTGAPQGDAVYDAIEEQVVALRGLDRIDVARETIDVERLKELSSADFDKDNPPEYVAASERLYKALGLMDEDASLRELFLDLIGSQVAGFYRPDDKKLYVVSRSGEINGADKITFAHEYDHALQDANFDIFLEPSRRLMTRVAGPMMTGSGSGKKRPSSMPALRMDEAKSLLNFWAISRASSRCCFWSSPTGTWVAR